MKNLKTKLTATALSSLMAISTVGAVSASAAEITTPTADRTIYFINNKGWDTVFDYTWGTGSDNVAFPGVKMDKVGTTDVLKGYTTNSDNENTFDVYSATVDANSNILFDEGTDHGQQSNNLDLSKTSANCFYLDSNNKIDVVTNFQTDKIDFNTTSTLRMSASESSNKNCYKSNGENILYINAAEIENISNVKVELTALNGTTTMVYAKEQNNKSGAMRGMYYIQVPQGSYIHAEVVINGMSYGITDITAATDSVKISNGEAVACQRVFFNNDLSTKNTDNQVVCAYAWYDIFEDGEVVGSVSETSFDNANPMTYYKNVCNDKINQYFYDVPLTYDHILFLTRDCYSGELGTQTKDIALNYTTNTDSSIIMDGYAPTTSGATTVSLFHEQVKVNASNVNAI